MAPASPRWEVRVLVDCGLHGGQQILGPYWTNAAESVSLDQFSSREIARDRNDSPARKHQSLRSPVSSYINIEDSEAVLRAIRLTPPDQPIDMILHTPGGLVLAAEQIARLC